MVSNCNITDKINSEVKSYLGKDRVNEIIKLFKEKKYLIHC